MQKTKTGHSKCANCGCEKKSNRHRFCCDGCRDEYFVTNLSEIEPITKCYQCGKMFNVDPLKPYHRFCSSKCYGTYYAGRKK